MHARPEPIGTRYRQASSYSRRTPRVCGLSAVALPRKQEELPRRLHLHARTFDTPAYAGPCLSFQFLSLEETGLHGTGLHGTGLDGTVLDETRLEVTGLDGT